MAICFCLPTWINFGVPYDLKWNKLPRDIESTIHYILVVKWRHVIKIIGNNKDFKNLSSHWKINGRNASRSSHSGDVEFLKT